MARAERTARAHAAYDSLREGYRDRIQDLRAENGELRGEVAEAQRQILKAEARARPLDYGTLYGSNLLYFLHEPARFLYHGERMERPFVGPDGISRPARAISTKFPGLKEAAPENLALEQEMREWDAGHELLYGHNPRSKEFLRKAGGALLTATGQAIMERLNGVVEDFGSRVVGAPAP